MELWIRSQDRTTLIRSYEIYISEQQGNYLIRAKRTSHILGSYKIYDRALEVLDEIQNILFPGDMIGELEDLYTNLDIKNKSFGSYVYQMPKE